MDRLKALWQKPWARNAAFLLLLGVLYFTGGVGWIQTQIVRVGLSSPDTEVMDTEDSPSLFGYDFRMQDEQGREVRLSDFRGQPIFLNFWASWCAPCRAEFPSLEDLKERTDGVAFLFISNEDQDAFEQYVSGSSHDLPFYRQLTGAPREFSSRVIPATFILDKEGKLVYSHHGAANWDSDEVASMLQKLTL